MNDAKKAYESVSHLEGVDEERLLLEQLPQVRYIARRIHDRLPSHIPLDDLVQAGYLKSIPVDPITSSSETWITGQSDTMTDINETQGGLDDVHSGSQALASDGTSYNTW